ncbi:aspartyl protease family protein [Effusibacillus lacus]|uniref:Peptidase A2 domain-containing protein n=1 Tax=Effusibacillus lacus TaxID=1348429 RepID=A0A292YIZ4_9BACL|nr:aspartyl protease family protein [Effusibacillus lacus]TCS74565.1 aspartyl protease [Effusibacillus lacus]GAX88440.1 hypothetical protein EFBL_0049 [Effusibacillus lacus]
MKIDLVNHLLHTSLIITYGGRTESIDRLVVDTGAAQTLISSDAVFDLGIFATDAEITTMYGIGGEDYAFRKMIDRIQFDGFEADEFYLDFGYFNKDYGINGIIGLDILLSGRFVIDLVDMDIYQK